jgi:hypothetical protein
MTVAVRAAPVAITNCSCLASDRPPGRVPSAAAGGDRPNHPSCPAEPCSCPAARTLWHDAGMTEVSGDLPESSLGGVPRELLRGEMDVPFWVVLAGVGVGAFWALLGVSIGFTLSRRR